MIEKLKPIFLLLTITCVLTFFLFGFTIYHKKKFLHENALFETSFACGTSAIDPWSQKLQELELNDTIALHQVEEGRMLFDANCRACHRMNHKLVGPALSGAFERRDSVWIRTLIIDIDILIKRKDKEIMKLRKEYNYTEHTRFRSLTKEQLDNLLYYLKAHPTGRF
jgi:hypothetical protein